MYWEIAYYVIFHPLSAFNLRLNVSGDKINRKVWNYHHVQYFCKIYNSLSLSFSLSSFIGDLSVPSVGICSFYIFSLLPDRNCGSTSSTATTSLLKRRTMSNGMSAALPWFCYLHSVLASSSRAWNENEEVSMKPAEKITPFNSHRSYW